MYQGLPFTGAPLIYIGLAFMFVLFGLMGKIKVYFKKKNRFG